jgi:HK97 family phage prohead protease
MNKNFEKRFFTTPDLRVETRDVNGKQTRVAKGYAAVFNSMSEDLGGMREMIAPGAFRAAITECDVRALIDHNPSLIIGRNTAGTLRMVEDDHGLGVEIDLPDTSYARDLIVSMERKDITGMSFGFVTIHDSWRMVDGGPVRDLAECLLFDVSIVTYPAYTDASVALRSLDASKSTASPPQIADPTAGLYLAIFNSLID